MKQTVEEAARIEREKVILELHDAYRIHKDPKHYVTSNVLIQKYAVPLFKAGAEWQLKQSPWISVEERLPEKNTVVLTRGAYGFLICQLSSLGEWETGANVNKERLGITHWMPIPSFDEILEANKDVLERIKEKAAWLKQIYEAPNPEVDKIVAELKEDAKLMPKNITKDEEIAWILKEANGEDDFEKLQAIISEDVTVQTEKLKESIVAHFQEACGASYSFRDILDNLDDDAIQEEIIKWARCNFLRLQIIGEKGEMQ